MKILYGASNRLGSNIQLEHFLKHSAHEVCSAAYLRGSENISHINWMLDALFQNHGTQKKSNELFGFKSSPKVNIKAAKCLIQDVVKEKPDLVISDVEPVTAYLSHMLEIPLWYCSPLFLLNGIEWEDHGVKYWEYLRNLKYWLEKLPEANRYLICSPFGDINMRPFLKNDFEWIKPYSATFAGKVHKRIEELLPLHNIGYNTGETGYIADCFYNKQPMCIIPSLDNPESMLNAILCEQYNIGADLGQVDTSTNYLINRLKFSIEKKFDSNYLSEQNRKYLHEEL